MQTLAAASPAEDDFDCTIAQLGDNAPKNRLKDNLPCMNAIIILLYCVPLDIMCVIIRISHVLTYMHVYCIMSFLYMFHSVSPRTANELRVALSTENGQSDYICASFLDVSPAQL